ncbi:MAG TPA: FtsX-like permease family protein [Xanthobacteraceae bacterium]|jgi:putative ABC transport system permease protein|nr:FtsX-like permease family protein [Xanthobacteraceae bacterium]
MNVVARPKTKSPQSGLPLTIRLALRDLRGGVSGFVVFIACIALGVMAIAGVGSIARSLSDGLAREGRVILGGDVAVSLIHREVDPAERAFLDGLGQVSVAATTRAMVRSPGERTALAEVKAVDGAYPLSGAVELDPPINLQQALAAKGGVFGAIADPALLARLDLAPGARIALGSVSIEIRAALTSEPDKIAAGIAFAPRLLISEAALRATGLIQPGSLVRWHYRVRLPENQANDQNAALIADRLHQQFPQAGWDLRTRSNASPQLSRNIERFSQFLTLVGLTALLIGGVGVANAVKSYLDRKREVIATMKSFGATGAMIFSIYLTEVMLLALFGTGIGLVMGAALPFVVTAAFGAIIPIPIEPAVHLGELAVGCLYGLLAALAFALWPLGRAHDVPVSALFRDMVAPQRRLPRPQYIVAAVLAALFLAMTAVAIAFDRRVAVMFVVSAAGVFLGLRLIAALLMWLARRAPRPRATLLRLVIANIHRPGALTPTIVLSLGLGLALLVTLTLIDGNLRRQFSAALPEHAPSFYFVDIQEVDATRFDVFVRSHAPAAEFERVPMLRGRIVSAKGIKAENLQPAANTAWVLQGDRGITDSRDVPAGSRVVAGEWWRADYDGPPLVSLENKAAVGLGLKIGDPIVVNVLGRDITAKIVNLRAVDWQTLGINFVLVYSPGTFRGAPHPYIATLTYPGGGTIAQEIALLKSVADAFPAITIVRVKDALEAVGKVVLDLTFAIRGASSITLIAAILVLGGALATGHRHRVYDAVVLKTLGATRTRLLAAYALEYLLLGLATVLFGVAAGSIAAALITTEVMDLGFVWSPAPALTAALSALLLTVCFGLLGTFSALGQKPAAVLRHL